MLGSSLRADLRSSFHTITDGNGIIDGDGVARWFFGCAVTWSCHLFGLVGAGVVRVVFGQRLERIQFASVKSRDRVRPSALSRSFVVLFAHIVAFVGV